MLSAKDERLFLTFTLTLLSDIKAFVSHLTGGTRTSSEAGSSDTNSKKPASEQQQKAQ